MSSDKISIAFDEVDYDHYWQMFLVCEDNQKSNSQYRNNVAGILLVVAGALAAFITDGGIDTNDGVPGLILIILGVVGLWAVIGYEAEIYKWMESGRKILEIIDEKYGTEHSKYYPHHGIKKASDKKEIIISLFLYVHCAYLWVFLLLSLIGMAVFFKSNLLSSFLFSTLQCAEKLFYWVLRLTMG